MEKSANPHMKHAFFKWFLHNRKNDIRLFQKKSSNLGTKNYNLKKKKFGQKINVLAHSENIKIS
jgi:hypothetical protein